MKVLVTGAEGYIGALLGPALMESGHEVIALDTGYYRSGQLYRSKAQRFPVHINKDLRDITEADLRGCDTVIHLAELSNDPLGQLIPEVTYRINHQGSVRLARLCRQAGVSRFVYTSSCSVYGQGSDHLMTEESATDPQTAYARCKVLVERDVSAMADDGFSPVFLRNATAFGASPAMRFDVVLNNLAGWAWTTREIRMTSDGSPWRPLVHVLDICRAVACVLAAPAEVVRNQVFNVGAASENYQVRDIAAMVAEALPGCRLTLGSTGGDRRSYRVSFDKIHDRLPGFRCQWTAAAGVRQLLDLFERIDMDDPTFHFRAYTRLEQLKYLIRTRQVDEELFWE